MKILVIHNAKSGTKNQLQTVQKAFKPYSAAVRYVAIHRRLRAEVTQAKQQGYKVIVAAGGDGTVSAVAAALAGSDMHLGIIPVGTLNHFAKDMKLPLTIDEAVEVILHGKPTTVDTALVGRQVFINNSSIGIYPALVQEREKQQLSLSKWPAAALSLIKVMVRMRRRHVIIKASDKTYRIRTPFLFVGNNSYRLHKVGFTNRTKLNQGQLSVYWISTKNPLRIARIFLRALLGNVHHDKDFASLHTATLQLQFRRPHIAVAFDGEVKTLPTPLEYKSQPGSLMVLVPKKLTN